LICFTCCPSDRVIPFDSAGRRASRAGARAEVGQYWAMTGENRAPTFEEVMIDLRRVRESGVGRIRQLDLPALSSAAKIADIAEDELVEPAAISAVLRGATDSLGGGSLQEAAEYLLGLYPGTALWPSKLRRDNAAEQFGVVTETFRKKPEKELLGQIAEAVLSACHDARLRKTRVDMETRRHPADSRLAVQWVERFEAYYRIWTPAYALAADLQAAIDTYKEEPSEHPPWNPNSDEPYDRDKQAQGYGHSALYWLASFWLEVKRFQSKHGGLWLLSDAQVEQDVADAVYRIGWHNELNDRDESFLRRHLADAKHEEPAQFWDIIQAFPQAEGINERWQRMIISGVGLTSDHEKAQAQVWLTIAACHEFCRKIDDDWLRIADWYRTPGKIEGFPSLGKNLYDGFIQDPPDLF
jgi:hypothetical protein